MTLYECKQPNNKNVKIMIDTFIEKYPLNNNSGIISIPEHISSKLPQEILELFSYGSGSYMSEFLWIVNPLEYSEILHGVYIPFYSDCYVFGRSAFGDLFAWEHDCVKFINVRHSYAEVIGRNLTIFFNNILTDWEYTKKKLKATEYADIKNSIGTIGSDECYGYFPLIAAGGNESITSIKKVKLHEHLSMIAQTIGKIS